MMKVGDYGSFREDPAYPWTENDNYKGRWQLTEYDAARGVWTADHSDGRGASFFTVEEMQELWVPETEWVIYDADDGASTEACQCPSRMLISTGHQPTCIEFNRYRKSKEPWRY